MTPEPQPDRPAQHIPEDPIPDPEPAAPSLNEPDPGVYHHQPGDPINDPLHSNLHTLHL